MKIPYFQVDAFTSRVFSGNPAGVCLLNEFLEDEMLQAIASENNLSETAFLVERGEVVDLRWFTPAVEVDLCGHATLAAAHVLYQHKGWKEDGIQFETKSGRLTVTREGELLALDFPSRAAARCEAPDELVNGLGAGPAWVGKSRDYLAVFNNEEAVRQLQPDMAKLSRLDCLGIIATAPGRDCDFVSRFFAPRAGVPEDPVTGSAHCTLIPYWADRLQRSRLTAHQVSRRGGVLFCEDRDERVRIGGQAVTYSSGNIHVSE